MSAPSEIVLETGVGMDGERRVAQRAQHQFGVITWQQCLEAGLGKEFVRGRVKSGSWQRLFRGIYKCSSSRPSQVELETAALLAAGDGAALSHRSAAGAWELGLKPPQQVCITVPFERRVGPFRGVELHGAHLSASDIRKHRGRLVTTVTRTIIDLSATLESTPLRICVESALRRRECPRDFLKRLHKAVDGRRGAENLRAVLEPYGVIEGPGRSPLESMLMEIAAFMPGKCFRDYHVLDELDVIAKVDFAWPEVQLAMEGDGFEFHADRRTFVRDRQKQNRMQDYNWLLYRFTRTQALYERDACLKQMMDAYKKRAALFGVPYPK